MALKADENSQQLQKYEEFSGHGWSGQSWQCHCGDAHEVRHRQGQ